MIVAMDKIDDVAESKKGWFNFYFKNPERALASQHLRVKFLSVSSVQNWVDGFNPDGEAFLRVALAVNAEVDETSRRFAQLWLEAEERKRRDEMVRAEYLVAERAAVAAERAANWAKWAAIATALGAIVTAVIAIAGVFHEPPVPQIHLLPTMGQNSVQAPGK